MLCHIATDFVYKAAILKTPNPQIQKPFQLAICLLTASFNFVPSANSLLRVTKSHLLILIVDQLQS